jgi:hypothetical protein
MVDSCHTGEAEKPIGPIEALECPREALVKAARSEYRLQDIPIADPPVGTHATISGQEATLADPDSRRGETPTKIINVFLRRVWTGQFRSKPCAHVDLARADIGPASEVCGECVALGDSWPALRMCLLCGYVGCCDKPKNKHAREHFRQTGNPLTRPYKGRGMDWVWCYMDEALLDTSPRSWLLGLPSDRHELAYSQGGRLDASHGHYQSSTAGSLSSSLCKYCC